MNNGWYNKQTQATKLLINAFLSLLMSALLGALTAGYQAYMAQGFNVAVIWTVVETSFVLAFLPALYKFVPAHAVDEIAFLRSSLSSLPANVQAAVNNMAGMLSSFTSLNAAPPAPQQNQPIVVNAQLSQDHLQQIATVVVDQIARLAQAQRVGAPAAAPAPTAQAAPAPAPAAKPYVDPLAAPRTAPIPAVSPSATTIGQVPFPTQQIP